MREQAGWGAFAVGEQVGGQDCGCVAVSMNGYRHCPSLARFGSSVPSLMSNPDTKKEERNRSERESAGQPDVAGGLLSFVRHAFTKAGRETSR
jgi:hypothetical protein